MTNIFNLAESSLYIDVVHLAPKGNEIIGKNIANLLYKDIFSLN